MVRPAAPFLGIGRASAEEPLQAPGPDPAQCEHDPRGVGYVDPELGQAPKYVACESAPALDQPDGQIVHARQIDQLGRRCGVLGEAAGEDLYVDNLVDIGDALVLGHGHRIDGMARSPAVQGPDVRLQIAGEAGEVAGGGGLVAHGAAVDHRTGRGGDLAQRAMEREPEVGGGEMVAIAMRDAGTDEVLDDVFLKQDHAERRARVGEQAGKPIVQIGMNEDFRLLRGQ
jgi:hypothetical protein